MTSRYPRAGAPPSVLFSFTAGVSLAIVACGGLLAARLSRGDIRVAVVAEIFLTIAVVAILHAQGRPASASVPAPVRARIARIAAQVVGAALGIAVAHSVLRSSSLGASPWLSERPAQFVNDAVAVFAPLAVVWAASRRPPSTVILVATLALVTVYRLTGFMWHVDAVRFSFTVQDLVTGEFAGAALGISVFRFLVPSGA